MKARNYRDTMELLYLKQGDPDRADFFLFLYILNLMKMRVQARRL